MNPRLPEAFAAAEACVVFYGTSLTRSGDWVEIIGPELQARHPALRIINAAEGGRHSGWGREHFAERVLAHHPTVVFFEFAINDAVARFGLSVADARANLEAMLDALPAQRPCPIAVLQIMNPVIDRPPGHDGHRPHLAAYEQVWREVAHARGLPLVDHAPAWAALLTRGADEFRRHVPDGLHPSTEAYAAFMLPTLREALGLTAPASRAAGLSLS